MNFHARATDPVTSHLAAASVDLTNLKPAEQTLIGIIKRHPNLNDDQIYERYLDLVALGMAKLYTPQAIRTIRVNLWRDDFIHVAGVAVNSRGSKARIWKVCDCAERTN
jgi:hypothetical protein